MATTYVDMTGREHRYGDLGGGAPKSQSQAPAVSFQGKANSALSSASGNASRIAGAAGQLRGMGSSMWNEYQETFAPVTKELAGSAKIPLSQYTDEAASDSAMAFDRQRGMTEREMGRMGINPNSGRFQGTQRELDLLEAAARAGAITGARNYGREANFSRMLQVANLGRGVASQATGAVGSAGSLFGSAAGTQMQLANMYGDAAFDAGMFNNFSTPGQTPGNVQYGGIPRSPTVRPQGNSAVNFGGYSNAAATGSANGQWLD